MKLTISLSLATLAVCAAGAAVARDPIQPPTRMLMRICNAPMTGRNTECGAWILGEVDGVNAGQRLAHGRPMFCLPPGAGPREKVAVVRKYMNDHPEKMSTDLGEMVASALASAYPCSRKG